METTSMEETTTIMPDTTTEKMCMDRFESCANIHPKDVDNFCTFDFAREACERRCGVSSPIDALSTPYKSIMVFLGLQT